MHWSIYYSFLWTSHLSMSAVHQTYDQFIIEIFTIVINMVITLQQALHPFFLTFRILGLGIQNPEKPYLSIFYNVTLWSTCTYLYHYVMIIFQQEYWDLITPILLNNAINVLMSIISMIISLYQYKVHVYVHTHIRCAN